MQKEGRKTWGWGKKSRQIVRGRRGQLEVFLYDKNADRRSFQQTDGLYLETRQSTEGVTRRGEGGKETQRKKENIMNHSFQAKDERRNGPIAEAPGSRGNTPRCIAMNLSEVVLLEREKSERRIEGRKGEVPENI